MITCLISAVLFVWVIIGLAVLAERLEAKYSKLPTNRK